MRPFSRRTFGSFWAFLVELWYQVVHLPALVQAGRDAAIPADFRERLLLAVTAVNQCRYCSWAHSRAALAVGVSHRETEQLLQGVVDLGQPHEVPALYYAQHWAESDGAPEPEATAKLEAVYGEETSHHIKVFLRAIRFGNLLGNSVDKVLHVLSRGQLGHG
ncbi:MAG: carboxymuconolactone decarboxylase family protein [Pseudomonadota bacterium]